MLTSQEMMIIGGLAGMGFLLSVFGVLLVLVSFLLIAVRIGNPDRMGKLL